MYVAAFQMCEKQRPVWAPVPETDADKLDYTIWRDGDGWYIVTKM